MSAADATRRDAEPAAEEPAAPPRPDAGKPTTAADRRPSRLKRLLASAGKAAATLAMLAVALLAALVIWDYYVTAPWTRDGRVRAQVASVAPQVSGQIVELRIVDNQYVRKGDVLYVIDPFDYRVALDQARTQLRMKAADVEVKKVQSERRNKLTDLATTPEIQQQYAGNATQAQAAFDAAQSQVSQAEINLKRTQIRSPVNGVVTNLLMRVGDYAHEGSTNVSVIDADSYWIDGYFEETKMARICVGDRAEAQLMGYSPPIAGRVDTVTRGISVSNAAPGTQGLPNVDPVYTWVRLAQRVPVRIAITHVPPGLPLVSGMTATVTVVDAAARGGEGWLTQRIAGLRDRADAIVHGPRTRPDCLPAVGQEGGKTESLPTPEPPGSPSPAEVAPGVAPGLAVPPRQ